MAQVIATGKWSKALKNWQMVVAIQRPGKNASGGKASVRRGPRPRSR